jgi:CDP-diacylglycerol--serine O-phosphatidyltransferase
MLPLLLSTVILAAITLADPFAAGALLGIVYVAMLPFSLRSYRRLAVEAGVRGAGLVSKQGQGALPPGPPLGPEAPDPNFEGRSV